MYGFSVLHCLPVEMAGQPSAGTDTVICPATLRRYATEAGFSVVETIPIDQELWRFYRIVARPVFIHSRRRYVLLNSP